MPVDSCSVLFQQAALLAAASTARVECDPPMFCEQVSIEEYEAQKLSASQLAIAELLEGIVNDNSMPEKEKKRRLKQVRQY